MTPPLSELKKFAAQMRCVYSKGLLECRHVHRFSQPASWWLDRGPCSRSYLCLFWLPGQGRGSGPRRGRRCCHRFLSVLPVDEKRCVARLPIDWVWNVCSRRSTRPLRTSKTQHAVYVRICGQQLPECRRAEEHRSPLTGILRPCKLENGLSVLARGNRSIWHFSFCTQLLDEPPAPTSESSISTILCVIRFVPNLPGRGT
jgi:hypothetical protein